VDVTWIEALAASWWLYPALYALVVADAFLVVVPSEVAVAALASIATTVGSPPPWALIPVAAAGALTGDLACYTIGRLVGLERWRWQREGRTGAGIARLRDVVSKRTAVLIFTARYVPFARIAVNLCVGAARVPLARYVPLAGAAGLCWALYNAAIGTVFGAVFREQPVLALGGSIVVAIALGLVVDRAIALVPRNRGSRIGAGGVSSSE